VNRIPVWFDTDIGVDDSVAFLVLNRLPQLELKGISAVAGNVELFHTYKNARNICRFVSADYPVYKGAEKPLFRDLKPAHDIHGPEGLGRAVLPVSDAPETDKAAWDAIYEAAAAAEGELRIATAGPLTNVATAILKYPALRTLVKEILIMGGGAARGNVTPAAEFNIHTDPEAAQIVFKSGIPVVMCGLDVTLDAYMTPEEVHELGSTDSEVCRFFRDATSDILEFYERGNMPGLCLHDVCPVLYLAHPELFSGREAGVYVETRGRITTGKTVTDLWSDKKFEKKNAFVVLSVDRPAFSRLVQDILRSY
jgi:inosine-uridine nucleoside N-ribohydrolase